MNSKKIILRLGVIFTLAFSLSLNGQIEEPQNQWESAYYCPEYTHNFTTPTPANGTTLVQLINNRALKDERIELTLIDSKQSPAASYYYYQLEYKNRPIYKAVAIAAVYPNGKLRLTVPSVKLLENPATAPVFTAKAGPNKYVDTASATAIWFPVAEGLMPMESQEVLADKGVIVNLIKYQGQIIQVEDERLFKQDTSITGLVYKPDPLTTANVFYGGAYVDNNDAANASLNAERKPATVKATLENGVFTLENDLLEIVDSHSPSFTPASQNNSSFNFNRSQSGFEDVNTLYHVTEFGQYLQSIGYNLPGFKISADAHGYTIDQSSYSPRFKQLRLGDGGVDDAEDADVIVHEYFHAVIDGANNAGSASIERRALEEAICDYMAQSHSLTYSPNQANKVFNWDGHNTFWPGREATSTKNYNNLSFFSLYEHTNLLVSCLADLESNIGRNLTNALVLESLYSLGPNTTYREFAYTMLFNDSLLNGASNITQIHNAFKKRQVLPQQISLVEFAANTDITVYNSLAFSRGGELTLQSKTDIKQYRLFNLNGQVVSGAGFNGSVNKIKISGESLKPGVYFLQIATMANPMQTVKLMRY